MQLKNKKRKYLVLQVCETQVLHNNITILYNIDYIIYKTQNLYSVRRTVEGAAVCGLIMQNHTFQNNIYYLLFD